LTAPVFASSGAAGPAGAVERRRVLAELLLERYGIVTREQVLAEGIRGGFAGLYDTFSSLETLGICRRGYFIEGMGGAQFALPGAVERLRAGGSAGPRSPDEQAASALVIAAADPAQPYGAALPWPRLVPGGARPTRVAGAYVVLVDDEPALYVERGGRALLTLGGALGDGGSTSRARDAPAGESSRGDREPVADRSGGRAAPSVRIALEALAGAVRAGRVPKLALERIDGGPAIGSPLEGALLELGFHSGPRRLTLSA
jgi:ATP-dependent helicase Lhr and Lhr-like helicase